MEGGVEDLYKSERRRAWAAGVVEDLHGRKREG